MDASLKMTMRYKIRLFAVMLFEDRDIRLDPAELLSKCTSHSTCGVAIC